MERGKIMQNVSVRVWKDSYVTEEVQETIVQYHTTFGEKIPEDICNCLKCGAVAKSYSVEGWLIDHPSFFERIYYSCDEYVCPECDHVWRHRVDREYYNTKEYISSWINEIKGIINWFK